jgi:hypothetical protein
LAFMADGMEISLLSFISLCAGSEWGLSDAQIALITSIGILYYILKYSSNIYFNFYKFLSANCSERLT